jgi:hypothetical protein
VWAHVKLLPRMTSLARPFHFISIKKNALLYLQTAVSFDSVKCACLKNGIKSGNQVEPCCDDAALLRQSNKTLALHRSTRAQCMFMKSSREHEKLNCLSNGTIYRNMVNAFGKVVVPSQALETDLGPPPYIHPYIIFIILPYRPRT